MSTIYVWNQELTTIGANIAATDELIVWDTSAQKMVRAPVSHFTGGAGQMFVSVDTTASVTTTGQSSFNHTITNTNVTVGDRLFGTLNNGSNTTGYPIIAAMTPNAGTITVKIANVATTATNPLGGTLVVYYAISKAT